MGSGTAFWQARHGGGGACWKSREGGPEDASPEIARKLCVPTPRLKEAQERSEQRAQKRRRTAPVRLSAREYGGGTAESAERTAQMITLCSADCGVMQIQS